MNWVLAGQTNMLGRRLATGLTSRSIAAAAPPPPFTPASLFAAGEQGVWYDPSDLTTMFQDSAGTTPVGTPGNGSAQPVGLLLDKSQSGVGTNGAYRYNKVNYSEDFTNAWWFLFNSTITATNVTSPTGTSNASTVNFPSTGSLIRSSSTVQWSSGASGTWQIWAKKSATGGADYIRLSTNNSFAWSTGLSTRFALTTSWQLLTITGVLETGTSNLNIFIGTYDVNGNNDSTCGGNVDIWGAQVAVSGAPSAYQKITSDWVSTMAGNHATQSTASARPELSAKYNLLTYTEQMNNAAWSVTGTISANATTAPDGTTTADLFTHTSGSSYIFQQITTVSGTYKQTISLKRSNNDWAVIYTSDGGSNYAATWANLATGVLGSTTTNGTFSSASATITSQGNGWYQIQLTFTNPTTTSSFGTIPCDGNGSLNRTSGQAFYLWGADLRAGNDGVGLPVYQQVADSKTYDSTGFPYFILFDGIDDKLGTATVSLSPSKQLSGWLSMRQLSSTLSDYFTGDWHTSNTGRFIMYKGGTSGFGIATNGGSTVAITSSNFTIPSTNIGSFVSDMAAPSLSLRANGSLAASSTASQGAGTFVNQPIYLSSDSTFPSNMRVYGAILRAASSTATEITNTETWLNGKTKAY